MSKVFKRPKQYANMGSPEARLIKYARQIRDQEQLDGIVADALREGVSKEVIAAWLERMLPHLPFEAKLRDEGLQVVG